MIKTETLDLVALDVSGQRTRTVKGCPSDCSAAELVQGLIGLLDLPANDAEERPLTYQARLEREGRALLGSELVGDACQPMDRIVLEPSVDAGAGR